MQPPWGPGPAPSLDAKAVAAVVLGAIALVGTPCWLGVPAGIPAIILGALALGAIRRSAGLSGGRGLAWAGITLGALGVAAFAVEGGLLAFTLLHPVVEVPRAAPEAPTPSASQESPEEEDLFATDDAAAARIVRLHPTKARPLREQLASEARSARLAGSTVLVETFAPGCDACIEITRAMRDPAMQPVLSRARLVLVDLHEFGPEADALEVDEPSLPWFYLVDVSGHPRDGISADEWDDNVPENIEPVLDAFVSGRLTGRRVPWKGGTAL